MIYVFACDNCGLEEDIFMRLTEYTGKGHMCSRCGKEMRRVFTPTNISIPDYTAAMASLGPDAKAKIKSGRYVPASEVENLPKPKPRNDYNITRDDLNRIGVSL